MNFRGTFEYALDAKHRLTIPAKYRTALADGAVLALWPEDEGEAGAQALTVWPSASYEEFAEAAVAGRNPLSATARQIRRMLNNNSWDLDLDSAGRLMIPAPAMSFARLDKEVVITGSGEFLEVWDRATHIKYNADLLRRFPDIATSFDDAG